MTLKLEQFLLLSSAFYSLKPIYFACTKNEYTVSISILFVLIFTICQHSTEKLYNTTPIFKTIYGFDAKFWLYADRFSAFILGFLLLVHKKLSEISSNIKISLLISFSFLILCDSGVLDDGLIYAIVHSLWHVSIFNTISYV